VEDEKICNCADAKGTNYNQKPANCNAHLFSLGMTAAYLWLGALEAADDMLPFGISTAYISR